MDAKRVRDHFLMFRKNGRAEIRQCESDVSNLQTSASQTYEGMAANLPKIIGAIEDNNEESRALIDYFISGDDSTSNCSVVISVFKEASARLAEVAQSIRAMRNMDNISFSRIKDNVHLVETLRASISEITFISHDIELLSYNAVFVAGQAGASGAAFTHIAKEIKMLSRRTSELVAAMEGKSDEFVGSFHDLNEQMGTINREMDQRLSTIEEDLAGVFEQYELGLRNMAELIAQTLDRADAAKAQVQGIMVSLQPQDLVRQILEQISIFNEELLDGDGQLLLAGPDAGGAHEEAVAKVEEASVRMLARSQLAHDLLEMAVGLLEESVDQFGNLIEQMRAELLDIDSDRQSLVDFFALQQENLGGKSSIEYIFDESCALLHDLLNFIKRSAEKKRDVQTHREALPSNLREIERCIRDLLFVAKHFAIVKVVSKVEIAREKDLAGNVIASSDMFETLTQKMNLTVGQSYSQVESISASVETIIQELIDNLDVHEANIRKVEVTITSITDSLAVMRDHVNDAVRTVGQGAADLFALMDQSLRGVKKIRSIAKQSHMTSARYQGLIDAISSYRTSSLSGHLNSAGDRTAYIRFPDLVEVVRKFNLYPQDSLPDSFEEVAMEESVSGPGDLVLF